MANKDITVDPVTDELKTPNPLYLGAGAQLIGNAGSSVDLRNATVLLPSSPTTVANVVAVSTIAALRGMSLSGYPNGGYVTVSGFSAANDGGGGLFTYNAGSSAADNGGTIIAPTIGSGRWFRVYTGPISVAWFGAKADGTTDDTTAIKAALDVAQSGSEVTLMAGAHVISSTLIISKALILAGQNMRGTFLRWTGGATPMVTVMATADNVYFHDFAVYNIGSATIGLQLLGVRAFLERIFSNSPTKFTTAIIATDSASSVYQIVLRDCALYVDASGQETPVGFYAYGAHTVVVDGCMFSGFSVAGVRLGVSSGLSVFGASITNSRLESFAGVNIGYPGGPTALGILSENVTGLNISGCNFEMSSDEDPSSAAQRAIKFVYTRGGSITGCGFNGGGVCTALINVADVNTKSVVISGNGFYRINGDAVVATSTGNLANLEIGHNDALTVDKIWDDSFTPGISFGGATTGITYSAQVGRYQRIGKMIHASGVVKLTNKGSATGALRVTGLPVQANGTTNNRPAAAIGFSGLTGVAGAIWAFVDNGSQTLRAWYQNTGSETELSNTNFNNTSEVYFSCTYQVED